MKKIIPVIIILLIFVVGLSVLLYPKVANFVNSRSQSKIVAQYFEDIAALDETEYDAMLEAAHEYNVRLLKKDNRFVFNPSDTAEYKKLLNLKNNDILGIVEISKINVKLPIYHGTSEGVLQVGAGHLEGTSLPVGGAYTHAAVTGHRGLPSSLLFTHLDKITIGDTFVITVLREVLTYEVDRIEIVEPHQLELLDLIEGKDYCTLITCTPYGVNSHRILVRGYRVPNILTEFTAEPFAEILPETLQIDPLWLTLAVIVFAIISIYLFLMIKYRRKRKK